MGLLLFLLFSLSLPVAAADGRVLSISVDPLRVEVEESWKVAADFGMRGQVITWKWSDLEPKWRGYRSTDVMDAVRFLGKEKEFRLLINLQVIQGTRRTVPQDLQFAAFDSPRMQERFRKLIDEIIPYLDSHVAYWVIGDEVDLYLARHPREWTAYKRFYEQAASYVRSRLPGMKMGVCVTHEGARGPDSGKIQMLTRVSDIWVTTYTAMGEDFRPLGPSEAKTALFEMTELAAGRPTVIQRLGYSSSRALESSEEEQADFIEEAFRAWELLGEKISFLNLWCMRDPTEAECDELAAWYGFLEIPAFSPFIRSIGLRQVDG